MARKQVSREASLDLPDGTGSIVVVADTHSQPHPALAGHLERLRPTAILHAGDIGDLAVLRALERHAPLFAVRGNIDERAPGLPDLLTLAVTAGTRALRILLVHIAVHGPKLRADIARAARARGAGLVVCGHSHVPFIGGDRDLTVFNPGSIGPRRFHLPILFGVIDITASSVRLGHFEAESGQPWLPPA